MPPEITDFIGSIGTITIVLTCGGIILSLVVTVVIAYFVIRMVRKTVSPNQGILKNGIPAKAKIISVQQTGVMVNYQPQVVFALEVQPPGGTPYQTQAKAVIPIVNIPQFQPGVEVNVKIHPSDPTQVALDIYQ